MQCKEGTMRILTYAGEEHLGTADRRDISLLPLLSLSFLPLLLNWFRKMSQFAS